MNLKGQEIKKYIDQAVGTEGNLRIPSWWMNKILTDLAEYCQSNENKINSFELVKIVTVLPDNPNSNMIYLIPADSITNNNVFIEWIFIDGNWEQLGEFKVDVDLSEYVKSGELTDYVKQGDLVGYVKNGDLATYAKQSDLDGYVKSGELTAYVKQGDLSNIETKISKLEGDSVIGEGEVDNSVVFKGEVSYLGQTYKNRAISQTAIALGGNTISGLKGYYITYADFETNQLWLHDSRTELAGVGIRIEWTKKPANENNKCKYVGYDTTNEADWVSIICNGRHYICAEIQSVSDNVITLAQDIPFTQEDVDEVRGSLGGIVAINKFDELTLFVHSKPDVGPVDLGGTSLAEGLDTRAIGGASHAEGYQTVAYGKYAHAEGYGTRSGYRAHAEGYGTRADGENSHAEGKDAYAIGNYSHAEGKETIANGKGAHAEGYGTRANGPSSHSEGEENYSSADCSHTEGYLNIAEETAVGAHVEGRENKATARYTHVEGLCNTGSTIYTHVEGIGRVSAGVGSHVEGIAAYYGSTLTTSKPEGKTYKASNFDKIKAGDIIHTVDGSEIVDKITIDTVYDDSKSITLSKSLGGSSHSVMIIKTSTDLECFGVAAHIEGSETTVKANYAHAEGLRTVAAGPSAHAEGEENIAGADCSHVEGYLNEATETAVGSHVEGQENYTDARYTHVEGKGNKATVKYSHVEGIGRIVNGIGAHVEGVAGLYGCKLSTSKPEGKTYKVKEGFSSIGIGDIIYTVDGEEKTGDITVTNLYGSSTSIGLSKSLGDSSHDVVFIKAVSEDVCNGIGAHVSGIGTITTNDGEAAFGKYNVSGENTIFSVGFGNLDERKNVFEITNDGNVYIDGFDGDLKTSIKTLIEDAKVVVDWNAEKGESGYIENKPFYGVKNEVDAIILLDITNSEGDEGFDDMSNIENYENWYQDIYIDINKTYTLKFVSVNNEIVTFDNLEFSQFDDEEYGYITRTGDDKHEYI